MLLSALYVRYRDVQPIWDVLSQVLFYLLPDHLHRRRTYGRSASRSVALLSPIAMLNTQMGHAVIGHVPAHRCERRDLRTGGVPQRSHAAGGYADLLAPFAILVGLFCLGWWVFIREAPRVAEHL